MQCHVTCGMGAPHVRVATESPYWRVGVQGVRTWWRTAADSCKGATQLSTTKWGLRPVTRRRPSRRDTTRVGVKATARQIMPCSISQNVETGIVSFSSHVNVLSTNGIVGTRGACVLKRNRNSFTECVDAQSDEMRDLNRTVRPRSICEPEGTRTTLDWFWL